LLPVSSLYGAVPLESLEDRLSPSLASVFGVSFTTKITLITYLVNKKAGLDNTQLLAFPDFFTACFSKTKKQRLLATA